MFGLPQFIVAPILSSLGSGSAAWPTIGAVIGWSLVAALVGSALGILRQYTPTRQVTDESNSTTVVTVSSGDRAFDQVHREAA
jgi:hypothetical protein